MSSSIKNLFKIIVLYFLIIEMKYLLVKQKQQSWKVFEKFSISMACVSFIYYKTKNIFTLKNKNKKNSTCWSCAICRFKWLISCFIDNVKSWISIDLSFFLCLLHKYSTLFHDSLRMLTTIDRTRKRTIKSILKFIKNCESILIKKKK